MDMLKMTCRILPNLIGAVIWLVLADPAIGQSNQALVGLPVAPDSSGVGRWEIRIWPNKGCLECRPDKNDVIEYEAWRSSLMMGHFDNAHPSTVIVKEVGVRNIQYEYKMSGDEFYKLVKQCRITAQGMLPPKTGSSSVSFGIHLTCAGDMVSRFVSMTFDNHLLANVYYLPDGPIWVVPHIQNTQPGPKAN